jgi:hypothetical protein
VVADLEATGHPRSNSTSQKVFEEVALSDDFIDFLTLAAYELIN